MKQWPTERLIKHQAPGNQINMFIISNCNKGRIVLGMKIESKRLGKYWFLQL